MNFLKSLRLSPGTIALLMLLLATRAQAQFQFTPGDLLLSVRQVGGSSEMVVNLGSVSRFTSAAPGSTILIAEFSTNQLAAAFAGFNNLNWSVSSGVRSGDAISSNFPNSTLWMTKARRVIGRPCQTHADDRGP